MIYALSIFVIFVIIDNLFKDLLIKRSKEIGVGISVVLLVLSTVLGLQEGIVPGIFEKIEFFSFFKSALILSIIVSIFLAKNKTDIYRKVISIFLLSTSNIEFQSALLFTSFLAEKIFNGDRINFKYASALLLLVIISLGVVIKTYGSSLLGLIFLIYLLKEELDSNGRPGLFNSLFFSIVLLVFWDPNINSILQLPTVGLTIAFLFYRGKRLLKYETDDFNKFLSISFISLGALAITGLNELYYLMAILLNLAYLIRGDKKTTTINWSVFFILLFFSPPFGLGYMSRVEVFEMAILRPWFFYFLVALFTLLTQLFVMLIVINLKKSFIEEIKKFKIGVDYKASVFIIFSILLSLLFLPENWIEGYGKLFKVKLISNGMIEAKSFGVGYYLFWIELAFWSILTLVYFKTSPKFFERIYFLNISLRVDSINKGPNHQRIESNTKYKEEVSSLKNIMSALEIGKNKLPAQYFSMMMIIILGLLLAGVM